MTKGRRSYYLQLRHLLSLSFVWFLRQAAVYRMPEQSSAEGYGAFICSQSYRKSDASHVSYEDSAKMIDL